MRDDIWLVDLAEKYVSNVVFGSMRRMPNTVQNALNGCVQSVVLVGAMYPKKPCLLYGQS